MSGKASSGVLRCASSLPSSYAISMIWKVLAHLLFPEELKKLYRNVCLSQNYNTLKE
jgi:hypothetical protein